MQPLGTKGTAPVTAFVPFFLRVCAYKPGVPNPVPGDLPTCSVLVQHTCL